MKLHAITCMILKAGNIGTGDLPPVPASKVSSKRERAEKAKLTLSQPKSLYIPLERPSEISGGLCHLISRNACSSPCRQSARCFSPRTKSPLFMPISDARALCEACPSQEKTVVHIPRAHHNHIFIRDLNAYRFQTACVLISLKDSKKIIPLFLTVPLSADHRRRNLPRSHRIPFRTHPASAFFCALTADGTPGI